MKYQIQYSYGTGDSFGNSDEEGVLEFEWEDLDVAKANLKRIKEHYKFYREMEMASRSYSYSKDKIKNIDELLAEYENRDWFAIVPKKAWYTNKEGESWVVDAEDKRFNQDNIIYKHDTNMVENCIRIQLDNGEFVQFWAPWCGYFETLYSAKIVNKIPEDNDLEIFI